MKYRADSDYAEYTGPDHGAGSRQQGMSAAAQCSCRYFIEIAYRFKKQDAKDSYSGAFDDGGFLHEHAG